MRTAWTVAALAGVTVLAACSSGPQAGSRDALLRIPVPDSAQVGTADVAGLGTVLVDGQGHTLYMFPPDAGGRVTCTGVCAGTWPPLVVSTGHRATAAGQTVAADLGVLADPNTGAQVITYGGYPLYRYAGDQTAGVANGQNLFNDGGPWYALHPDLQPVTVDPVVGTAK